MRSALKSLFNRYDSTARWLHGAGIIRHDTSFLRTSGWFRSAQERMAVDNAGKPIPWMTYSAIYFLDSRLNETMSIFEYGSGNSTLFWSSRARQVVSCEHDAKWHSLMKSKMPNNVTYLIRNLENGAYENAILESDHKYHVIVIDGRNRTQCAENAVRRLSESGVIIWDNSEREKYSLGLHKLQELGFRRIDFKGMVPIVIQPNVTTILYRPNNCLGV